MPSVRIMLLLLMLLTTPRVWGDGPGFGNLEYFLSEQWQSIAVIDSPLGHGNAAMINGYLMVVYSSDGGGGPNDGGIDFWDVSNPRNPTLAIRYDNAQTHRLREAHCYTFSKLNGADIMVTQGIEGIQFWDVTDPLSMTLVHDADFDGINAGAYSGAWWVHWQAPHLYIAAQGAGLYVVDVTNINAPQVVDILTVGELAGVIPAMCYAVGNLLVIGESQAPGIATLDISNPLAPTLIQAQDGHNGYSHLFAAGKILTSGGNGSPSKMYRYDVASNGTFTFAGEVGSGFGNGGYGCYQDGNFFSGFSWNFGKLDVDSLVQYGAGSSGINGRDEDFAQVFGNLVFVGDDHGVGSALVPHLIDPDVTGPDVHWVSPANGATDQALTTRVGLSMSDNIDLDSIDTARFAVRPLGGSPLAGTYSVQMGLVNFAPQSPLQPGTTYEVVVNGLVDWSGNVGGTFSSIFSTAGTAPSGPAPVATLTSSGPQPVAAEVLFEVQVDNPTGNELYTWNFGDGSAVVMGGSSAAHAYDAPGRYGVTVTVANASGTTTGSMVQIVHRPLVGEARQSESLLATDTHVIAVLPDHDRIVAVEKSTLTLSYSVEVADDPQTLARSNDGSIWVVSQGTPAITVVDPSTGSVVATYPLPHGSRPYGIVFEPTSGQAFITLQGSAALLRVAPNGIVNAWAPLSENPRGVGWSPDGRLFVSRFLSGARDGLIWEFDPVSLGVTRTITLSVDVGPDTELSGRGALNYLSAVIPSPDASSLWIPAKKDNVLRGQFRDGQSLDFESLVRTSLARIDLSSNSEDLPQRRDLNDRNMAQSGTTSPLGDLVFVGLLGSNAVDIYDAYSGQLVSSCDTGRAPRGLVISDGRLYVNNFMSRSLSVFDAADLLAARNNIATPLGEVILANSETSLTAAELQGKRVFYNAADPRMSRDGYSSCASCHLDGGHDGQVWDFTQVGEGLRNTISLRGKGGLAHGRVHWTANFDEIQDFEHDIRHFAGGSGFLSDDEFEQTSPALGAPKAGLNADLDALAAYVSSLDRIPDSPYRNFDGSLGQQATLGRELFIERGCHNCHGGAQFRDGLRHDVGTSTAASGQGQGQPLASRGFDTPTLLGVWNTAPYLHNGQAQTLEEVLLDQQHVGVLSSTERLRLVSYLRCIDSVATPIDPPIAFLRGDFNGDAELGLIDSLSLLTFLFDGDPPLGCYDAADTNDDGMLDVSDSVLILGYLYMTGSTPPSAPFPDCGRDLTSDALDCAQLNACPQ